MARKPDIDSILGGAPPQVEGADGLKADADRIKRDTDAIEFDWSGVNNAVGLMEGVGQNMSRRAQGEGLTAGYWAQRQQPGMGQAPQTVAELGKFLLEHSRTASMKAAQTASAGAEQQAQFGQQALALQSAAYNARMEMARQQLALDADKFRIRETLTQSQRGLDLVQLAMKNDYYAAKAGARNAIEAIDIDARRADLDRYLSYIGMGLGAAAAASAAAAANANQFRWQGPGGEQLTASQINQRYGYGTGGPGPTFAGSNAMGGELA